MSNSTTCILPRLGDKCGVSSIIPTLFNFSFTQEHFTVGNTLLLTDLTSIRPVVISYQLMF